MGDRACTNDHFEEQLFLEKHISLIPKRRKDLKRQHTAETKQNRNSFQ
ncbi:hypothetical protein wcw_1877 [Waddlia chondrophila WSU 86-1044]|uniref:Transposase n=1 Tax=Waddlia chondrophila (strain ATCC VR-1470 / WSU 86-1044) TaxID=716544 RepID=D6YT20_WADCW|nr:hypothetical protein wcw_1877 [Waddlia chondrophila WSU 86-1044]